MAGATIFAYSMLLFLVLGDSIFRSPEKMQLAEAMGWLRYIILLLGIILGMRAFRKQSKEEVTYGKAFLTGLLVSLMTSLLVALMEYVYVAFMNPGFYAQYTQAALQQISDPKQRELFEAGMKEWAWMQSAPMTAVFYFFETAVFGTILSLIAAAFYRKKGVTA